MSAADKKREAVTAAGWRRVPIKACECYQKDGHFGLFSLETAYERVLREQNLHQENHRGKAEERGSP